LTIYHAPAVRYPTGFSARLVWFFASGLTAGCVTAAVFTYLTTRSAEPMLWQNGVLGASCLLAVASAGHFLYQLKPGWLDWSGQAWHWVAAHAGSAASSTPSTVSLMAQADQEGQLSVRFDGQSCLLVYVRSPVGPSRWLWLEESSAPQHWHDVRRAVYSRAPMPVFTA
jgi:toxin CptA